jgi:hypothetical protein
MRIRQWLISAIVVIVFTVVGVSDVFAQTQIGVSVSSNFAEWMVVGLQEERPNSNSLVGIGGYAVSDLFWSLSARPWVLTFLGADNGLLSYAAGFDLLWTHPSFRPHRPYVGFGFTVSDFQPNPITNFMIGYQYAFSEDCSLHMEARLLFLNSLEGGFGCNFNF